MNLPHVHLLLNHFPTVGFSIGLVLLLVALIFRSEDLKLASLGTIFLMAVVSLATYVSGNAAQEDICTGAGAAQKCLPGVSANMITAHQDAALMAFIFMELTGALALLALWKYRRTPGPGFWNVPAVLLFSIVTFGLMAKAANIGGEIRHPEIQGQATAEGAPAVVPPTAWLQASSVASFVTKRSWVWPASETLHFIGLCLLFTVVLLVDLRMLGMAKSLSYKALHKLLPLGLFGFVINLITGMLFFIAAPGQYTKNGVFYWKVLFIMLAGINVLYFMLFDEPWTVGPGVDAPLRAKVIAASAIFIWISVLFCGHMLPFIGNAF